MSEAQDIVLLVTAARFDHTLKFHAYPSESLAVTVCWVSSARGQHLLGFASSFDTILGRTADWEWALMRLSPPHTPSIPKLNSWIAKYPNKSQAFSVFVRNKMSKQIAKILSRSNRHELVKIGQNAGQPFTLRLIQCYRILIVGFNLNLRGNTALLHAYCKDDDILI